MKAAVLLLLPLAVSAFSPLAGRTVAKSSTIARNGLQSNLDWRSSDPEPEVRWLLFLFSRIERWHRIESLAFHAALNAVKFDIFILLTFIHSFVLVCLLYTL